MTRTPWRIEDRGSERVLYVGGREYRTHYSDRVLRLLIERKGIDRAPLYLPFRETRGRFFLERLLDAIATCGGENLSVLEVGCSLGHVTEYLDSHGVVGSICALDVDRGFVELVRANVADLGLRKVRDVVLLSAEETTRLPYADATFDLVIALAVVEHLPVDGRHRFVDEWYRVLKPGGWIGIFDTPNRWFPFETHTVGLPLVQWLPPRLAYVYARTMRPGRHGRTAYADWLAPAAAWRNATYADCLPSRGRSEVEDVTEELGYGYRFFRDGAQRTSRRRRLMPLFRGAVRLADAMGLPPSAVLPYLNLVFRKRELTSGRGTL